MSFTPHSAAYSLDKETDLFGHGYIDPSNDFFDEFLTFESIEGDKSVYPLMSHATDLVNTFRIDQSAGTTSILRDGHVTQSHLQEPVETWDLDFIQKPLTSQFNPSACNDFYSTSRRASCSDSDLLSLEGISLEEPSRVIPLSPSLPSSPLVEATVRRRDRFIDSLSKTLSIPKLRKNNTPAGPETQRSPIRKVTLGSPTRKVTLGSPTRKVTTSAIAASATIETHRLSPQKSPSRSPIRKATSPAKMMRASQYSEQNLQEWQAHLQAEASKFDFGFQNPQPLSPPPSARVSDASDNSAQMMSISNSQHGAFTWDQPCPQYATQRVEDVHTPLTTPTGVHSFAQQMQTQNSNGSTTNNNNNNNSQANHGLLYPPSLQHSNSWEIEQPYNVFVPSSQYAQEESEPEPVWWSHATQAPLAQPLPSNYHRAPVQDTKTLAMQLQNELVYNASELALSPSSMPQGLMIQMPHSPVHQPFTASPMHNQTHQPHSYFPLPHAETPRHRHHFSGPRTTPHPQSSPRQVQPPQTMRKSRSHANLSDSPSPTSRSASFHVQKRRNGSQSRAHSASRNRQKSEHYPTTPKTPKTPRGVSSGGGFADFVNFTPSDSGKILTGVAPSGSSKTKARREKEAMEKRRRLSMAAMRAVQAAGGSIDSLVEEGLLV